MRAASCLVNNLKNCSGRKLTCCRYCLLEKKKKKTWALVNKGGKKALQELQKEQNKEQRPNKDFHPAFTEIKKSNGAARNSLHFIVSHSCYECITLWRSKYSWEQTWLHHGDVRGTSWLLYLCIMQYVSTAGVLSHWCPFRIFQEILPALCCCKVINFDSCLAHRPWQHTFLAFNTQDNMNAIFLIMLNSQIYISL